MLCNAKVRLGKKLVQQRLEKHRAAKARISRMTKPIYDNHYAQFKNQLEEQN